MTSYRGLAAFTPGAVSSGDSTQYVMGLSFKVTSPGCQLDGWWWWCDIANGQDSHPEDFALWQSTGGTSGIYIAGSKVTSGTFGQGLNFIPCGTPIPLTSGQEYRGVKTANKSLASSNNYTALSHFFDGGGAAQNGSVNGPLTIFGGPAGAIPEPTGNGQMTFIAPATDVTVSYPASEFNESWYGLDVQVSDSAAHSPAGLMMASFP